MGYVGFASILRQKGKDEREKLSRKCVKNFDYGREEKRGYLFSALSPPDVRCRLLGKGDTNIEYVFQFINRNLKLSVFLRTRFLNYT